MKTIKIKDYQEIEHKIFYLLGFLQIKFSFEYTAKVLIIQINEDSLCYEKLLKILFAENTIEDFKIVENIVN
jgi:plasmid rolling circle replication initiator protein Rep